MRHVLRTAALGLAVAVFTAVPASAGEHRIGLGYHYFETLDDLEFDTIDDIDESGSSLVASYQYLPGGLIRFEVDLEYWKDGYGGTSGEAAYAPQVYALIGRGFYGGVGVGITHSDGFTIEESGYDDEWSDPWFAARAGVDLLLLPKIHLDINANYRADAFNALDEAESDAITLGASLRISF